jgi:hypothetical protein
VAAILLVLADGLFAPDRHPAFGADPTPFVVLMVAGFVVAVAGHVVRMKTLVATGIAMIFLATFVVPLLINIVKSSG